MERYGEPNVWARKRGIYPRSCTGFTWPKNGGGGRIILSHSFAWCSKCERFHSNPTRMLCECVCVLLRMEMYAHIARPHIHSFTNYARLSSFEHIRFHLILAFTERHAVHSTYTHSYRTFDDALCWCASVCVWTSNRRIFALMLNC